MLGKDKNSSSTQAAGKRGAQTQARMSKKQGVDENVHQGDCSLVRDNLQKVEGQMAKAEKRGAASVERF